MEPPPDVQLVSWEGYEVCKRFSNRFLFVYRVLSAGSLPSAVGGCVFFGAAMGAFDHMGGLNGPPKHVIQKPFFKEQDLVARVKSEINELDKV